MTAASALDLIERASPFGFTETLRRVAQAIEAAGLVIFARIDHAEGGAAGRPGDAADRCADPWPRQGRHAGDAGRLRPALDLPLRALVRDAIQA